MTDISSNPTSGPSFPSAFPPGDPNNVIVGMREGISLFNHSYLDVVMQMPLPGIMIFVHGVNSDGEWYTEGEKGLCAGLNDRLKRNDEHLFFTGPEAGQLHPANYLEELTPNGFINPDLKFDTFIKGDDTFSPVIHFRWGYKASLDELQDYGGAIYLNEENYWGGGPFANGCTSLPDLWSEGLSDNLFLWLHVQHLNPVNDRNVYSCPPRPYYVLAALRLARLVESLRQKQADVPITIVCHSQGNMIGMAAAFLGDRLKDATDGAGKTGRCVADTYVLCNAPFSLLTSNGTESWTQGQVPDKEGRVGRQTGDARIKTLKSFFNIVRAQAPKHQDVESIDKFMANEAHGFNAQDDRMNYGYGIKPSTYGRVTLYCNPHDQVISSTTVQGIGWRGMSQDDINATGGTGIFSQRVFAQDFEVGKKGTYDYWSNQYNTPKPGSWSFWSPESPAAEYTIGKGIKANTTYFGKVMTVVTWPIMKVAIGLANTRINALPPKEWSIPLDAPNLPETFKSKAKRFGDESEKFDQGFNAPGQSRDKNRVREEDDPYAGDNAINPKHTEGTTEPRDKTDAAQGNTDSESSLRYEYHALLRMQAKREGKYANDKKVTEEDKPETASDDYKAWQQKQIKTTLVANVNSHATDHSTIMTNGMHAQKALAYDVAIGNCHISQMDLHKLRIVADWRFLKGLDDDNAHKVFEEYFLSGKFDRKSPYKWAQTKGSGGTDGSIPDTITDEREFARGHQ